MSLKRFGACGCLLATFVSALIGFLFIAALEATPATACNTANQGDGSAGVNAGGAANTLNAAQIRNVQAIIGVGKGRNIPQKGIETALAVAIDESTLIVVNHGDAAGPDSRGLFQQRDPWGPIAVRMDAVGSANLFYNALLKVPGWERMSDGEAGKAVQNGPPPSVYMSFVPEAQAILAKYGSAPAITGGNPGYFGPGSSIALGENCANGVGTAPGSLGELSGTPAEIVARVIDYAHTHGFLNVTPASVRAANAAHGPTVSGGRSDHEGPPNIAWAADMSNGGGPTKEMDALAATIAQAFKIPWHGSGLVTAGNSNYRLQLIYRTCDGGDHWNHVHFGVHVGAGPQPATTLPSTSGCN